MQKKVRPAPPSDFLTFLLSILDASTVYRTAGEYRLGVTKSRDVIFYRLTTGGKPQLGDKLNVLSQRTIVAFPDVDGYDTWVQKAAERPHLGIIVSDLLEKSQRRKTAQRTSTSPTC